MIYVVKVKTKSEKNGSPIIIVTFNVRHITKKKAHLKA